MSTLMPPIPHKAELIDDNKFLTPAWSGFFKELFRRIGGNTALSNIELETVQTSDLTDLTTEVELLQSQVATIELTSGDFNQGRYL